MIIDQNGNLFKYVEDSNRGENETKFYDQVFTDNNFVSIRSYLPKYYGLITLKQDQQKRIFSKFGRLMIYLVYIWPTFRIYHQEIYLCSKRGRLGALKSCLP